MNINDAHSSNEELNSIPLLRDTVIKRECKFQSPTATGPNASAKKKLIIASVLCFFFFLAGLVGGILANSLAILTDSAHLFSDLSSFLISLVAIFLSARPSSKSMTYGWHRAEILGALFSILLIWIVTVILVYAAVLRILHSNYVINAQIMLIMSAIGVIINVILAAVLHPHSHSHEHGHGHSHDHKPLEDNVDEPLISNSGSNNSIDLPKSKVFKEIQNINLRAAFIHVVGDIIQSFGVLAAAFIIYFKPEWKIADPICTFLFSVLVIFTTVFIFRDVMCVLLERKPRHLNYNEIELRISSVPGVIQVHNLRLWSITLTRCAISCHLHIDSSSDAQQILDKVYNVCIDKYKISDISIQLETSVKNYPISYVQSN